MSRPQQPPPTLILLLLFALTTATTTFVLSSPITLRSLRKLSRPITANCYGNNYDGVGVNEKHPTWGMTSEPLIRLSKAAYLDGVKDPPRLATSARALSNAFNKQGQCDTSNDHDLSAMFYAFGQFVDHDISFEGKCEISEKITPHNFQIYPSQSTWVSTLSIHSLSHLFESFLHSIPLNSTLQVLV